MATQVDLLDEDADGAVVPVLVGVPIDKLLDYRVEGVAPPPGSFVRVPVSGRIVVGVVWDGEPGDAPLSKLKFIESILDLPTLPEVHRRFIEWVAKYTMSHMGSVLKMTLSSRQALQRPPMREVLSYEGAETAKLTPARKKVVEWFKANTGSHGMGTTDLAMEIGVSPGVLRGMRDKGLLVAHEIGADVPYADPNIGFKRVTLRAEQAVAVETIKPALEDNWFETFLLEGVTGSGKTEVYFEAIAEALRDEGAQVLVLLPEIALTSQWLERFQERFGVEPTEWHSDLGIAERRRAWRGVAHGDARLVVGARSALFLPFRDLRLIVVDEEHDQSFKQETGVIYHARDMAVVRAKLGDIPILLSSATPSFESVVNAQEGRYTHLELQERHGVAELPEIEAVDMRREAPPVGRWISPPLEAAISDALLADEQSLLFLNRRGYAPLTLCRACGTRIDCPNCTAWLVEHRYRGELVCHHCGHQMKTPTTCPECETEGKLAPCGPGVERLEEEVKTLFPEARILVMTSDTIFTPAKAVDAVRKIEAGKVDIIIGTQIITKGYHFPNLTVVGVVDADLGLKGADLRAVERTYQQLSQVAGRAGRADRPGRVLLQTFSPETRVVEALTSGDKDGFVEAELKAREHQHVPPYGRMAGLIVTGMQLDSVLAATRALSAVAPFDKKLLVLGPAPAPLARLRGRHRYRYLISADRDTNLQREINAWLKKTGPLKGVQLRVDIDPISFQ